MNLLRYFFYDQRLLNKLNNHEVESLQQCIIPQMSVAAALSSMEVYALKIKTFYSDIWIRFFRFSYCLYISTSILRIDLCLRNIGFHSLLQVPYQYVSCTSSLWPLLSFTYGSLNWSLDYRLYSTSALQQEPNTRTKKV